MKHLIFTLFLIGCNVEKSQELDGLAPKLRGKVATLISRMEDLGYETRVSETFRSPSRQKLLVEISEIMPGGGVTSTSVSRHSRVHDGKPASCAVDLRPAGFNTTDDQAEYYAELRKQAKLLGLSSGADFQPRRSSPFYEYGLGWDPGHIYAKVCG